MENIEGEQIIEIFQKYVFFGKKKYLNSLET